MAQIDELYRTLAQALADRNGHVALLLEQVDMHHPSVVIVTDLGRLSRKTASLWICIGR